MGAYGLPRSVASVPHESESLPTPPPSPSHTHTHRILPCRYFPEVFAHNDLARGNEGKSSLPTDHETTMSRERFLRDGQKYLHERLAFEADWMDGVGRRQAALSRIHRIKYCNAAFRTAFLARLRPNREKV